MHDLAKDRLYAELSLRQPESPQYIETLSLHSVKIIFIDMEEGGSAHVTGIRKFCFQLPKNMIG